MKDNRKCFKNCVDTVERSIHEAKMALNDNLNISNEKCIQDCKELDEYFYSVRNRLRNNFKCMKTMKHITAEVSKFLNQELIEKIDRICQPVQKKLKVQ